MASRRLTADQRLRKWLVEQMGDPEIDVYILLENMQRVFEWIRTGAIPVKESRRKPALRPVATSE